MEAAAGRGKNRPRVLGNVSDFVVALKHSALREILNEHQSKGPRSELEPLIIPQHGAPERSVAVEEKASGVTLTAQE